MVEEEWFVILVIVDREEVIYLDFVIEGIKFVKELRDEASIFLIVIMFFLINDLVR